MVNKNIIYSPQPARDCSDTAHYNAGCNQQFCLPAHRIEPAKLAVSDIDWTKGYTKIPIVIQVCADCGPMMAGHSHITYAEFYKPSETTWSIRAIKQKQAIDGVCYLLQEIYGIENKAASRRNLNEDDDEDEEEDDDDSSECVVCLSETRDTLILPCKHLCLCSSCANQLRYQQSGCPICRQSFRALLQVRAVRKKTEIVEGSPQVPPPTARTNSEEEENDDGAGEDDAEIVVPVPDGYEVVPLIEAIKGSVGMTSRTNRESSAVSTSADNITVVDETAPVCSGISSTGGSVDKVLDSDSGDDSDEVTILPKPVRTSSAESVKNPSGTVLNEVPSPLPENEQDFPEGDEDKEDINGEGTSSHVYTEINLPGVAICEPGAESGESQNSTKELLPQADHQEEQNIDNAYEETKTTRKSFEEVI